MIPWTRLKVTSGSDYTIALGIKGWNIDISNDYNQTMQVHSETPTQSATDFDIRLFF